MRCTIQNSGQWQQCQDAPVAELLLLLLLQLKVGFAQCHCQLSSHHLSHTQWWCHTHPHPRCQIWLPQHLSQHLHKQHKVQKGFTTSSLEQNHVESLGLPKHQGNGCLTNMLL